MHNPRNKSHSTKNSDHNNQDQELLVLMVLVGIGQDDQTGLMGMTQMVAASQVKFQGMWSSQLLVVDPLHFILECVSLSHMKVPISAISLTLN